MIHVLSTEGQLKYGLKSSCQGQPWLENDGLICEFALSMIDHLGLPEEQRRKDMYNVRKKVRLIGRLLTELKEEHGKKKTLPDFFVRADLWML